MNQTTQLFSDRQAEVYRNGYTNRLVVGFDEFGRTVTAAGARRGDKQVGIFYHLWLGSHPASDNYNMTEIRKQYGDDMLFHQDDEVVSPAREFHFWDRPMYGYYSNDDEWVIRRHMELLTLAGVDFLVFDVTNAYPYIAVATRVMAVISDLRGRGWSAPQVVFYTHARSIDTMRAIYREIYRAGVYPDAWYRVDGKPMIIAYSDAVLDAERTRWECGPDGSYYPAPLTEEEKDFFYFREPVWPYDAMKYAQIGWNYTTPETGWPYVDWVYPQRTYGDMMVVSTSSHPGVPMSNSIAIPGLYYANWGRGYDVTTGQNKPENVLKGTFFESQWETVHEVDPRFVFITGWNEWVAIKVPFPNQLYTFCDCASLEFSRDIEPMKGGYRDAFYIQMMSHIRRFKYEPADVPPVSVTRKTVDVHAAPTQWADVASIYRRVGTDNGARDALDATRKNRLTRAPFRNNLLDVTVSADDDAVYFGIRTAEPIQIADDAGWMNLFIGRGSVPAADRGWEGYEFVVNRSRTPDGATIEALASDYSGETLSEVAAYTVQDDTLQISIPRRAIGLEADGCFYFKVADHVEDPADIMEYYNSGCVLPRGRMSYLARIGE